MNKHIKNLLDRSGYTEPGLEYLVKLAIHECIAVCESHGEELNWHKFDGKAALECAEILMKRYEIGGIGTKVE